MKENKKVSQRQTFINNVNNESTVYVDALVNAFSSANIPLFKLNNPELQKFFSLIGAPKISETKARKYLLGVFMYDHQIYLKQLLLHEHSCLIVDTTEITGLKYCNVLVSLIKSPHKTFLLDCVVSNDSFNSGSITRIIRKVVTDYEMDFDKIQLLISDAARYMIKAGKDLKVFYPNLSHICCLAHLVHNCALHIRSHFTNVDELIAAIKMLTVKNKTRADLFSSIGTPPQVVITRWSSWLRACFYYSAHLPIIKLIVNSLPDKGMIVRRAMNAVQCPSIVSDLISIKESYEVLIDILDKFEKSQYTIQTGYEALININFKNDPVNIKSYIQERLKNNEINVIVSHSNGNISPDMYVALKNCIPTSIAVERSFSMLNKMLSKDRNFAPNNVYKYLACYYNNRFHMEDYDEEKDICDDIE